MVEALLFLGELLLMGVFLLKVSRSDKTGSKQLGGFFDYKDSVAPKKPGRQGWGRPGA